MTQYLITEIRDSTGYVHRHISKVKENEYMRVVEADSKEEALEKHKVQMQVEAIKKFGNFLKGLTDRLNKE
ncbi:hypothetical protein A9P33_09405 [Staphylococcus epidermidis]|uniref:DUF1381 domain-containing protein n=1 Tax=Staphylococcus epidermidis TaxID=1282 RepID=UPI0007E33028|nr:DUF1381 domain-containing protein [Staphylococcus epidermidis]MDU7272138.1 DUF1381 domain-containing protein [Staphylococcus lugdunensis]MCG1160144.1 DUF1381 domain-containing protein [Staphylococcus epidermidis]OAX25347.1 hypothetical protein A9P33_09405 [Staphylococcus epidermidis]PTE53100.1 DUF1381 domain-containing protein [Staphylococcus epidermidis]PTE53162.1 DUF1381 domain-containing protein [Staphylococcus epidermidis]